MNRKLLQIISHTEKGKNGTRTRKHVLDEKSGEMNRQIKNKPIVYVLILYI